jgi:hypothetical protein
VPPPDLDLAPRPVPRAPLTDVVPKRTLVIIAVVVALAVLGTVLALTLGGGDDKGAEDGGKGTGSHASASADAKASVKEDTGKTGGDDAAKGEQADSATGAAGSGDANGSSAANTDTGTSDDDHSGSGSGPDSDDYGSAPPVSAYDGSQKFSIRLPKGWRYLSADRYGVRFTGPDGQRLLVAWTSEPKDDPVADWKRQEGGMVRPEYKRVRIEKVGYRGWNTADWEFTYTDGGTKYRVIDRGFVVDDTHGYALMYTARAADWGTDLRKDTWRTLTKTFEPK